MDAPGGFREVWAVDFEYGSPDGERPAPRCVVARELRTGRVERRWLDGVAPPPAPPYPTGPDVLFVAYYASAELGCHLALGWPTPARVLDLCAEYRAMTNGCPTPHGRSLLGALARFGLYPLDAAEKDEMRAMAIRGGPYTAAERDDLLAYCQSDVDALARLLPRLLPTLDLPRALLRGRYMAAAARMEWTGVPIDVDMLARLRAGWDAVKNQLVRAVDRNYRVYVPVKAADPDGRLKFSQARWAEYLARAGIPWPRTDGGRLSMTDETFKDMAKAYPAQVGPVRELRHTLGQLRLNRLAVGPDGRNRCLLSAFQSSTGRNQPSNARYIFGPSVWLRSLIKPGPGRAVAYIDWSQQELGIAAALSRDPRMMEAYRTGDFYLAFAKMAGAVPADATKQSHPAEREAYKTAALGVLFGMTDHGLARRMGGPPCAARGLLAAHRRTFRRFWEWSDGVVEHAALTGEMRTVFGWPRRVGPDVRPTSLRNFPMQANGAEMMRLAACLATERGVSVCGPVHDAFLIEADVDRIDAEAGRMRDAMREASEVVLPAFPLGTDTKVVRYPERYADPRGEGMWATVMGVLDGLGGGPSGAPPAA